MMKNVVLRRYIFTKAQTGNKQLDTHYSFLNKTIQAYVKYENDILIEYDILKTISFNGGIYGTTYIIVDAENLFVNISLNKNSLKIRTGAWETHELC